MSTAPKRDDDRIGPPGFVGYVDGILMHYCWCGAWGAFGYGVKLSRGELGEWFCREHRPAEDAAPAPVAPPPSALPAPSGPGPGGRDADFPALPYVPDSERCWWSEEERFKRHCLEISENAKAFDQRLAYGMPILEAAKLQVPWTNRHSFTELLEMRKRWPRNGEEEL
jgi:hypothetical protein